MSDTLLNLLGFYSRCRIVPYIAAGWTSIFDAYSKIVKQISPKDEDIVIFCHDDLEILENEVKFVEKLELECKKPNRAFVGLAGTTFLSEDAVWWNQDLWKKGFHRGSVTHLDKLKQPYESSYGPEGEVVALDGLFLATTGRFLKDFNLEKPVMFHGDWDYYDIHYTTSAFLKGFENFAMRLKVIHHSRGELAGRASWYANRDAFMKANKLPMRCNFKELI